MCSSLRPSAESGTFLAVMENIKREGSMRRAWKTSRLVHIVFAITVSLFMYGCGGEDSVEGTAPTAAGGSEGGGTEGSAGTKAPPRSTNPNIGTPPPHGDDPAATRTR